MQKFNSQALLSRTKVDLTKGKGCLMLNSLVPSRSDVESAIPLEEYSIKVESTALAARVNVRQEKVMEPFCMEFRKLGTNLSRRSNGEADATRHPKREAKRPNKKNYAISPDTAESFRKNRGVRERAEPKSYKYEGRSHFVHKYPTRSKEGQTRNTPGKENPSERTKSQGARLNPGQ
jgi:hypothetical protein